MLEEVKDVPDTTAFVLGIFHRLEDTCCPMACSADHHRLVVVFLRRELSGVFTGRERPERFLAEEGGVGIRAMDGFVKSLKLLSGEKEVDAAKTDEGSVFDREPFRELELGDEWGGGKQIEVLLPIAFEPWIFGVIRSRADVGIEKAG